MLPAATAAKFLAASNKNNNGRKDSLLSSENLARSAVLLDWPAEMSHVERSLPLREATSRYHNQGPQGEGSLMQ